jgi:pimeloyl-ACP methyl ester carboxylesterase
MRLMLVHSPLTGPSTWGACAAALAARGVEAEVARLPPLAEASYEDLAQAVGGAIAAGAPASLVVHSGAGGLAAAIVAQAQGRVRSVVFVDAILPHPGRSWFDTAAPALGESLRARAKDGAAPRWDQWFPEGALGGLIPDGAARGTFLGELRPTPLSYLQAPAPDLEIPADIAWGYVRLSKAYEVEAGEARRVGAPTLRLDLNHLAMITHPQEVATTLLQTLKMLG